MCGIAGIIPLRGHNAIESDIELMTRSLDHRGPDSNATWVDENTIALGHARLSIQDLSPNGAQPMHSKSGRYVIAFNGEIYNFISIRQKLSKLDHNFIGGSDTEVLLAAIEEWGIQRSLDFFEGMFAFSLWDKFDKTLYLCRDRLGEKPLFYGWTGDYFVWASELKALRTLNQWQGSLNNSSLSSYLKYGYIPAPQTIYNNCYKLIPGSILKLTQDQVSTSDFSPYVNDNNAKLHPKYYWNFSEIVQQGKQNRKITYRDSVDELERLLLSVIQDQMISDVPYGSFLSGGIDSSLVTSLMQSLSSAPINTFTIGFTESDFNEAHYAKEIANHLGTNHNELYISSYDCQNLVPNIPSLMDEPFADSSILPAYFVSKLAKQHVTVCLSGDGGDELFCGYNRYTQADKIVRKVKSFPRAFRSISATILGMFPPATVDRVYSLLSFFIKSENKNTRVGLKLQKLSYLLRSNNINEIYETLISYCQNVDDITKDTQPRLPLLSEELSHFFDENNDYIEKAMAVDTVTYLPDDNLTKVDRTSMVSSLETRLPLLNHKVVELAWNLPLEMKVHQGVTKRILRDTLFRRVPRRLIERPKMGFSVPIAEWLRGPLNDWAKDLLFSNNSLSQDYLNMSSVQKIWDEHSKGQKDNSAPLWCILMFQSWLLSLK